MLLIDGVKYSLWNPPNEDEFERVVVEHAEDIFGENALYLDRKQKLKSLSGVGSIPDGYVIICQNPPEWHIVEAELSSHPLHEHIVSQVSKFINGIKNPSTQRDITNAIYNEIVGNEFLTLKLRKGTACTDIHKLLSDAISKPPILTIIIEKDTEGLREAIATLNHPQKKIVEFQTFTREGAESVRAHLFEPLCISVPPAGRQEPSSVSSPTAATVSQERPQKSKEDVTLAELIESKILKVGQTIYASHKGQQYQATVLADGKIRVTHNNTTFGSLSLASVAILGYSENGWRWWHTKKSNGVECRMDELRQDYINRVSV